MKTLLVLTIGFSGVIAAFAATEEKPVPNNRVTVTYVAPEKFTDFSTSSFGEASEKDLKYLTEIFSEHIEKLAKQYLAVDEKLEIAFKDIDLAGRFEPERGPNFQDVRIYRDITFPRMKFSFRLLGSDGQLRLEGERKLTDMHYNMKILPPTGDSEYRHDKALLSDWIRSEFKQKRS